MTDQPDPENAYETLLDAAAQHDREPSEIAFGSLKSVEYDRLRRIAAGVESADAGATAPKIREQLVDEGYFVGPVGDDTIYRTTGDEIVVVETPGGGEGER